MIAAALVLLLAVAPEPDSIPDLGELDALPGATSIPPPPDPVARPSEPTPNLESDASQTEGATVTEEERETFGDIFTGSMRLTGAFLHFDDVPALYPDGDDALLASVFRVIAKRDLGKYLGIEMNYFVDLSRSPGGGAAAGAFTTAGTSGSVYRSPYLQYQFWRNGSMAGRVGADRFVLNAHVGPVDLAIGRFPVTYSVTGLFTPNDFFAPFSATAVNRIYKPGVDAARAGVAIGMNSSVEVVGVMGNDDGGNPTWARSGLLARAATVQWGFEWAAMGGKVAERWVAGASSQGDVGPVTLRGEAHVGIPGREHLHVRLAAGPSVNIGWHGLVLGGEYAFVSDGARKAADYLERLQARFPDDQPQLARHYAAINGSMEIVPILHAGVFTLLNANDGSGLTGLSLIYNVADEADIIAGVFAPWGGDPYVTGDPMAPIALRSEYGASPVTVYLEARAFF